MLVAPGMMILGHVAFFLLLGSILCKNNRLAKSGGKSSRKSGGIQGADISQSPPVNAAAGIPGRGSKGSAETRRDSAAAAQKARQQTGDMKLHFLKNNQVSAMTGRQPGEMLCILPPLSQVSKLHVWVLIVAHMRSAGFIWRSQEEVGDGWFFWKVIIYNFTSWFDSACWKLSQLD